MLKGLDMACGGASRCDARTVSQSAGAAGLTLQCQLLDPATQQTRTTFHRGEKAMLKLLLEIPQEAADRPATLKLGVRAVVSGIPIAYGLDDFKISLPNRSPGADTSKLPYSGTVLRTETVDIPADLPLGSVAFRAKLAIDGVGKQSCSMDVSIVE